MTMQGPATGRRARAQRSKRSGTKVLVAVEDFWEPGRECLPGELLWPTAVCGRWNCTCGDELHGITTHGNASVGRVRLLPASRALIASVIVAAMRHHEGFDEPQLAAERFLDELASIEVGRLVRREEGVLLPFPLAARITGPGAIRYHLDDEP